MLRLIFVIFLMNNAWASKVRHVEVTKDEIVPVRTSIGIATIIQVPDRPNSVVVGDQDSFKVEYLDQAITIKPIVSGARSNLYVYTDYRRFNIELITGPQSVADYVVYLKQPKAKKTDPVKWKKFTNTLTNDSLKLNVKKLGMIHGEVLLIEFELTSNKPITFKPEWMWLTQNDEIRPIHNLVLNSLSLLPGRKVSGLLQVRKSDLDPTQNFRIEVRRTKMSYLTLPKVGSWSL